MIRLGTDPSAPSGISLEITCRGSNKRVSLRGWFPHENTIPAIHWTLEEFAHELGLIVPERKKSTKPKRALLGAREEAMA
jgi:hypothetical protein